MYIIWVLILVHKLSKNIFKTIGEFVEITEWTFDKIKKLLLIFLYELIIQWGVLFLLFQKCIWKYLEMKCYVWDLLQNISVWGGGWPGIQMKQNWPCIDNYGIRVLGTWKFFILFFLLQYMFENLHTTKIFRLKKNLFS